MCAFVCVFLYYSMCVKVRDRFLSGSLLLWCGSQGLNDGHEAW